VDIALAQQMLKTAVVDAADLVQCHAYWMPPTRTSCQSFSFDPFPKRRRGIGRSLLTLDRGATLIAYGSYLARLALDYLRILTSIADWRYTDSYSRLHRLMLAFLLIPSL